MQIQIQYFQFQFSTIKLKKSCLGINNLSKYKKKSYKILISVLANT